jgi:hypothetical protein
MNTKVLLGKTIRKVHQARFNESTGRTVWSIGSIEFTDGTRLALHVLESDGGDTYGIDGILYPARKEATGGA